MTKYAYGGDPTGLNGKYHYGGGSLGVLGSAIPSEGDSGTGYLYGSLNLPADANKEYYGLLGTIPVGLTIDAAEDSSFTATGANGFYEVPFTIVEDGTPIGDSYFTVVFGNLASLAATNTQINMLSSSGLLTVESPIVNLVAANTVIGITSGSGVVTITPPETQNINLVASNTAMSMISSSGLATITPAPKTVNLIAAATLMPMVSGSGIANISMGPEDPRYGRPKNVVSAGPWTPSVGDSLISMINDTSADSSTYISTTEPGSCVISLNSVGPIDNTKAQVVRYQAWSETGSGANAYLMQGETVIASWVHSSLPTTPTIFAGVLTSYQRAIITDYANLRFKFTAV